MFTKLSPSYRWLLVALSIFLLAFTICQPTSSHISQLILGTPSNDLFDEVTLHTTVTQNLLQGRSLIHSDNLDYPIYRNLLATHKSYLHILFVVPLTAWVPWPQWWNLAVMLALALSTLVACYALVRLSNNWSWGILLGISFMSWQWLRELVSRGHLVQLWSVPLYLAIVCLILALREKPRPLYFWGLIVFTLITSFVYWIWGACLAILGLWAIIYWCRELDRKHWLNLTLTVGAVLMITVPAALYVVSVSWNLPKLQRGGGMTHEAQSIALKRASGNSVIRSDGQYKVSLPAPQLVAPILAGIPLVLLFLACRQRSQTLFWLSTSTVFLLLGWGPYCIWRHYTMVDGNGEPIRLPYYYLADWTGLGYRWQTPDTVTPFLMFSLAMTLILAWNDCRQRSLWPKVTFAVTAIAIFFLTVHGASGAGMGNKLRSNQHIPKAQPFFPCFAYTPYQFVDKLQAMPPGALLEFPLGFTGNVWQLQHLHRQRTCHGRYPIDSIMEKNNFVLWLYRYSRYACKDLRLQFVPDVQAVELPYGTTVIPEYLLFRSNHYPVLTRRIDRRSVESDYYLMYGLGVRYAVLHRCNCEWLAPGHGDDVYKRLSELLGSFCGQPLYSDDGATIFAWPTPTQMNDLWPKQPWKQTLPVPADEITDQKPTASPICE